MSTQVHTVKDRIRQKIKQSTPRQVLENVSDEPIPFSFNGLPYDIPPSGPWAQPGERESRAEVYDGTLEVTDQYGVSDEERKLAAEEKRPPQAYKMIATAMEIVAHALSKLEGRGVFLRTGDPEEDAELRAAALERWIEFKREQVASILSNYRKDSAAFFNDPRNAGKIPPAMSKSQLDAQRWFDKDRLGMIDNKIHCKYRCGMRADSVEEMDIHYGASHSMENVEPVEVEVKRGPGRPKKVQEA